MKRTPSRELLDSDAGSPAEVAGSLADLRLVNRWFGGIQTTRSLVRRVLGATNRNALTLLEVASGSADVALATRAALLNEGVELKLTALDRLPAHLPNGMPRLVADARSIPFRENSFDVVSCALFAHHLAPQDVARFATEAMRVARIAVLINDLIRSPLHLALVYSGMPLYRSRLTRNDAPASVRQAYTPGEMLAMLKETPAARVELSRHYLFRMGVIAWKHA